MTIYVKFAYELCPGDLIQIWSKQGQRVIGIVISNVIPVDNAAFLISSQRQREILVWYMNGERETLILSNNIKVRVFFDVEGRDDLETLQSGVVRVQ